MSTYKEIAYMCLDELKGSSDDTYYTVDHVIFLADKYRAFYLKKTYEKSQEKIPESNYQTLCVNLEESKGSENQDSCLPTYLISKETIPDTLPLGKTEIVPLSLFDGEITYVDRRRFKYTGSNRFLKDIIYATLGKDNRIYVKSGNPQFRNLEKLKFTGIFEDASKASLLECGKDGEDTICDPLDRTFPSEEALIPMIIQSIVQELREAMYRPSDLSNNATDDFSASKESDNE